MLRACTSLAARQGAAACAQRRALSSATAAGLLRPFVASDHSTPSWSLSNYSSLRAQVAVDPITSAELAHLAQLSHLALPSTPAASEQLLKDVESVVEWVGTIRALDMDKFEPMFTPLEVPEYYTAIQTRATSEAPAAAAPSLSCTASPDALRLRPDQVTDGGIEKQILANASYKHRGFFVVPKTGDGEDS